MFHNHQIEIDGRVARPGRAVNNGSFSNWRTAVAQHRWRGYGLERILRMVEKLTALQPSVLPMKHDYQLEFAITELICVGGRGGKIASESLVNDLRNAIEYWHFVNYETSIPLDSVTAKMYFKSLPQMRVRVPKNLVYDEQASHGHLQMPSIIWWSTVSFWLRKNAATPQWENLGAKRDTMMLILLWVMFRRQGDVFMMSREVLRDNGPGLGFTWSILEHKTARDGSRLVLPIPERLGDIPVAQTLRDFLIIAPKSGFIFRATTNRGKEWEPPTSIRFVRPFGTVEVWEGFSSGAWNMNLQRCVRTACPWYTGEVKMFTAHTLRGGATVAAAEAGTDLPIIRSLLSHRSDTAIYSYTRLTQPQLAQAYSGTRKFLGQ